MPEGVQLELFRRPRPTREQYVGTVLISGLERWMGIYATLMVCGLIATIMVVLFGTYSRKETVEGYLYPDKGLIKVYQAAPARTLGCDVTEGQYVKVGNLLCTFDVTSISPLGRTADLTLTQLSQEQTQLEQEIMNLPRLEKASKFKTMAQIEMDQQELSFAQSERAVDQQIVAVVDAPAAAGKIGEHYGVTAMNTEATLEQTALTAELQQMQVGSAIAGLKGDLEENQATLSSIQAQFDDDRDELLTRLETVVSEIAQETASQTLEIRAPQSGIVTKINVSVGSEINGAVPVLTIIPTDSELNAMLYVTSEADGFVKVGDEVDIRYDSYPFQKFGVQPAVVTAISKTSVGTSQLPFPSDTSDPVYIVTAKLHTQTILAYGNEIPLQAGAHFQADLILDKRRIWEWVVEPLSAQAIQR